MSTSSPDKRPFDLYLEQDLARETFAHQHLTRDEDAPPLPDVKRILKVVIPVEFKFNHTNDHIEIHPHPTAPAEIDPCGYIDQDALDSRLVHMLSETFPINGPQLHASGRQLIDIDHPLLATLFDTPPDSQTLSTLNQKLTAHDRDPSITGSHTYNLLRPDTRSIRTLDTQFGFFKFLKDDHQLLYNSVYFDELCAMVAERRGTAPNRTQVHLDNLRTAYKRYQRPLEILRWFREDHRLSYDTIADLLDPGRDVLNPDQWLLFVLYDLANGLTPEEIISHGTYWGRAEIGIDEARETAANTREEVLEDLKYRLLTTTFETLSLKEDAIVREWWCQDPPRPYPLSVIRLIMHIRDFLRISAWEFNRPLIINETRNLTNQAGDIIAGYKYQDPSHPRLNPFQQAMAGAGSPDQFNDAFKYRLDKDKFRMCRNRIGSEVLSYRGFSDHDEFIDWLRGGAPVEMGEEELIRSGF